MWCELIVSALTSAAAGLLAIQVRRYEYWRGWVPTVFWSGLTLYVLANAGLGALVVSFAHAVDWHPAENSPLWGGLIYAGIGQAAIRVEAPRPSRRGLEQGSSLLSRTAEFAVEILENASERAVQKRFGEIDDEQMIALSLYLYGRYVEKDEQLTHGIRMTLLGEIVASAEKIEKNERAPEGRGELEYFSLQEIVRRSLHPVEVASQ